ncbi:universal stress protein [Dechloromonas sp. A34]|uniref:universal stress protein n=1 Tax=Dechloromonas sp. A34 TaxID=447588 RepID=UPI002248857E|nr:universal stress protein [Dechloromonas sp. A34]
MAKLSRLLAATDLSAPARHAAERAAIVAKASGATLNLIHVASLAPLEKLRHLVAELPPEVEQRVIDNCRDELHHLAATLLEQHGVAAGSHVVTGPLLDEIANLADAMAADLLILGARGASFMRHLLLGSTAERMISQSSHSLLVVKQAAHVPYRRLLVPVDFSPSSRGAISAACAIAGEAEIVLLHATVMPFEGKLRYAGVDDAAITHYQIAARAEAMQKLTELRAGIGVDAGKVSLKLILGDPSQHIIEQEQELDCDLIVIGKHGESALEELLIGSVTRHVLTESQCDVLVSLN